MSDNMKIKVFIADDFDLMREVIHLLIKRSGDMEVVGEAPRLEDALEETQALNPDVIIMNDYLPPTDSAAAAEKFRKLGIETPILIISMKVELEMIKRSFESGANGFMYKDEMGQHLIEAIRKVHGNERYLSPLAKNRLGHLEY
jgi:two-component system, NarL family, response regulator DesR